MTQPAPIDLISRAERIEADAWLDLVAAAPPPVAAEFGLHAEDLGGAVLVRAARAPVTLLNRIFALGARVPGARAPRQSRVRTPEREGSSGGSVLAARDRAPQIPDAATERHLTETQREKLHFDLERALSRFGTDRVWVQVTSLVDGKLDLLQWPGRTFRPAPRRTWAKLIRSTEGQVHGATALAIREVRPDEATEWARLIASAHEMPPASVPWTAALVGRPNWVAVGAFSGQTCVGGAALHLGAHGGWLGLSATHPDFRRRGVQSALIASRIDTARMRGALWVGSETGEPVNGEQNPSLQNLRRVGFDTVCSRSNWEAVSA